MCIFTAPVRRVANTRIFVAPLLEGRQLSVYENNVEQNQKTARNAMVLPVPSGSQYPNRDYTCAETNKKFTL